MSKSDGMKIGIKFDAPIFGDISGNENIREGVFFTPIGTPVASSSYSSYSPSNAFDNITSNSWYARNAAPQWIYIKLLRLHRIFGFRIYLSSSERPKNIIFEGSLDGTIWTTLKNVEAQNIEGWQEYRLPLPVMYLYYRWTFTSYHSSYCIVSEIQLLEALANEGAFNIDGSEYEYYGEGSYLLPRKYKVKEVSRHPTIDNAILLHMDYNFGKFSNAEGSLVLSYDVARGDLEGLGGKVDSFTVELTPTDLIGVPNPVDIEYLTATVITTADLIDVYYTHVETPDSYITAIVSASATLTFVGVINP